MDNIWQGWDNYNNYTVGIIIQNNRDLQLCQKHYIENECYSWYDGVSEYLSLESMFPITLYIGSKKKSFGFDYYDKKFQSRYDNANFPTKYYSSREKKLERILKKC